MGQIMKIDTFRITVLLTVKDEETEECRKTPDIHIISNNFLIRNNNKSRRTTVIEG